ncbi:aldo/keto reductase [Candidatus Saganbacteria bacterium]|uniref:Aldo/keto reductase n=1 Tax=Candidatus Saganbacteria bacterium TaxID=2575572 RepID=A0A9D6YVL0_UNCSA|nr:aldo/keto reductase [Candidatus Saganbacteria bacterium]
MHSVPLQNFLSRPLGSAGLDTCALGVAGGYGVPTKSLEEAFERGVNYFYHGSLRRQGMNQAIKNICAKGKRDKLIIAAQDYMRMSKGLVRWSFDRFLAKTGLDYVDVLLLGWHNTDPDRATLETALDLKTRGLIKHIAISGHNRKAFPEFAKSGIYGVFHFRYNAVHNGAETDIFPFLPSTGRPGTVVYTATCWKKLLNASHPANAERKVSASDCYRFVLSNPSVDMVITGPKSAVEMIEALRTLELGPMSSGELEWMRKVGSSIR